jgi:hypothetical protein
MLKSQLAHLRGEAVTLWRLERAKDKLHCFIVEPPGGFWLGVERGADLVYSETHTELQPALMRADSLKSPLIVAGWKEVSDH